jgi:hypothetical protein
MRHQLTLIGGALAATLIFATPAVAQHCSGPQIGTWKLQSYVSQDLATGQKTDLLGSHPSGFISYGPDCRMQAILIVDGRKAPAKLVPTDAERIQLYNGFGAYAGTYSIKGDIVSHHIDASWNQVWTGTTQARRFKIEGKTLRIETLDQKNPMTGKDDIAVLVWIKVK